MVVKRVDVEYLLEMATQSGNELDIELCRAWLALDAAPEREVGDCCGHFTVDTSYDLPDEVQAAQTREVQALIGQRVRLVATQQQVARMREVM